MTAPKNGHLYVIDRATGKVRWSRDLGDSVLGAIALADGKLVCPIRSGQIAVLEAATGKNIWRTKVGGGSPIIAGCGVTPTRIYAVNKIGQLHTLHIADGMPAGPVRSVNDKPGEFGFCLSAPVIAEGRLYVGSETGGFRCFVGR